MSYPPQGSIINNDDHPDDSGLHADQEDHWGTTTKVADVVEGPTGGSGATHTAAQYATGATKDPKVISIGMDKLKAWRDRSLGRAK